MVYGSAEVWSFMSCPASAASRGHRNLREASRMVGTALPNTLTRFPASKPSATPNVRWSVSVSAVSPAKGTRALAKPKMGRTAKVTHR
jgi:hypothetical protein